MLRFLITAWLSLAVMLEKTKLELQFLHFHLWTPEVPYCALTIGLVFGITTAIALISKKVPHVFKPS
jgi:hypothetical protein